MKTYDELLEENKQLKIKLSNAYNELAVWKTNSKLLKKELRSIKKEWVKKIENF